MYPKVKVREDKDDKHDVTVDHKIFESLSLRVASSTDKDDKHDVTVDHKIFESLPIRVASSPVKEDKDVSPPFVAKIQKSKVPNAVTPMISAGNGTEQNDKKIDEKDRPNIRATSILRPRAVLSSPDNDAVIGNKNKITADRPRVLRNHNSVQNRHANAKYSVQNRHANAKYSVQNRHANAKCKVIQGTKSQTNTKLSNDAADNKSDLKGKKGSVMAVPTQRRDLRSGKSSSVKT